MIRILQVVNAADRGGAETMVMNLYRKINRDKIQFDFTNHKAQNAAYDSEIKTLGGRIFHLPKFKGYNYLKYVKAWKELLTEHPEFKIIHIHNYNIAGIVADVARKMGVKTIITHSHSTRLNMSWPKKLGFYLFYKSLLNNSSVRFSCGHDAGVFLFKKKSFTVVPNAIDTSKFRFDPEKRQLLRSSLGYGDDLKIYVHVASFRTPKNHSFLIDVFSEILKIERNARLILIGTGDLQEEIKQKTTDKALNDYIKFLGLQNNVNEWLNAADVFLLPSLWEGLPVSVVEAQCAGLPCVISDVIDKEVDLTDNVTFLSLKLTPFQWAEQITKILPTNRVEMGKIVASSNYDITTATKWISNFYQEAISK